MRITVKSDAVKAVLKLAMRFFVTSVVLAFVAVSAGALTSLAVHADPSLPSEAPPSPPSVKTVEQFSAIENDLTSTMELSASPSASPVMPMGSSETENARPVAPGISFLTYNLGLLRVPVLKDQVPMVKARAKVLPKSLVRRVKEQNLDFVMLQEVWDESHADAIAQEFTELGYTVVRPKNRVRFFFGNGLLLAVSPRFHVTSWVFHPYRKASFPVSLSLNGILQAYISRAEIPGKNEFIVMGTHSQPIGSNSQGKNNQGSAVRALRAQLKQLSDLVNDRSAKTALPIVVLGDLNCGEDFGGDLFPKFLADSGLTESRMPLGTAGLTTWDRNNPLVKHGVFPEDVSSGIDHVLFRGPWTPVSSSLEFEESYPGLFKDGEAVPLSDHYGVLQKVIPTF